MMSDGGDRKSSQPHHDAGISDRAAKCTSRYHIEQSRSTQMAKLKNPNKITAKLAKRFEKILASLPDDDLYRLTWTDDQRRVWWEQRSACTVIGRCFAARFGGENDPIAHLKQSADDWTRLSHAHTWRMVDYYEALWGLTQMSWFYVKKALDALSLSCPFERAWDFFIAMISTSENSMYAKFLQNECKTDSAKTTEKNFAVAAKMLREKTNPLKINGLTPKEREVLSQITKDTSQSDNHWFAILIATAEVVSPSDEYIRDKYKTLLFVLAAETEAMSKLYADSRKGRVKAETGSEHWIDGIRYRTGKKNSSQL